MFGNTFVKPFPKVKRHVNAGDIHQSFIFQVKTQINWTEDISWLNSSEFRWTGTFEENCTITPPLGSSLKVLNSIQLHTAVIIWLTRITRTFVSSKVRFPNSSHKEFLFNFKANFSFSSLRQIWNWIVNILGKLVLVAILVATLISGAARNRNLSKICLTGVSRLHRKLFSIFGILHWRWPDVWDHDENLLHIYVSAVWRSTLTPTVI